MAKQWHIIAEDCGSANARQTAMDRYRGWGQAQMSGKQQRIIAEDGGKCKCMAEQQQIVAEDRGTCQCRAEQQRIIAEDRGTHQCKAE